MLLNKILFSSFSFLMLCLLTWQSAQLIWQVVAPSSLSLALVSSQSTSSPSMPPFQLFGSANTPVQATHVGAPDAQVLQNWLLLGTMLDGEHSLALVQMGALGLRWLKAGERLDNGLQVVGVLTNEIQLLTAQGVKSLVLFNKQTVITTSVTHSTSNSTAALLQSARQNLKQNPMSAMQFMRMDPVWSSGQLSGLTLMPQPGQEALFNQLGLKAGDVLVGLNGESLGAWMSKMADLPKVLDAAGARVKVLRAGAETEWMVNW